MTICVHMNSFEDAEKIIKCFPKEHTPNNTLQLNFLRNRPNKYESRIVLVKDNHWVSYNAMKTSGPGTRDDWCERHNSKLYNIDDIIRDHPELFI